jgi:hypothetical protein
VMICMRACLKLGCCCKCVRAFNDSCLMKSFLLYAKLQRIVIGALAAHNLQIYFKPAGLVSSTAADTECLNDMFELYLNL